MSYDPGNIFARILRGEIPCNKVYEDDYALAFHDIQPQAPVHVLIIPKGEFVGFDDFASADAAAVGGFFRAVGLIAAQLGLPDDGYRILANNGRNAHQEVPHFHLHLLAGCDLGGMVKKGLV